MIVSLLRSDLFESVRKHETVEKAHRPKDFQTEIGALDLCCKHRTHCLIHDVIGMMKVNNRWSSSFFVWKSHLSGLCSRFSSLHGRFIARSDEITHRWYSFDLWKCSPLRLSLVKDLWTIDQCFHVLFFRFSVDFVGLSPVFSTPFVRDDSFVNIVYNWIMPVTMEVSAFHCRKKRKKEFQPIADSNIQFHRWFFSSIYSLWSIGFAVRIVTINKRHADRFFFFLFSSLDRSLSTMRFPMCHLNSAQRRKRIFARITMIVWKRKRMCVA